MRPPSRFCLTALLVTLALARSNCGCGGGRYLFPAMTLSVAPTTATVQPGANTQFTGTVDNGPPNTGVTWALSCAAPMSPQQYSGSCGTLPSTASPSGALWQRDTVTDLGSLGGAMSNAANAINNRGQVVGQSDLPGDAVTHAFFWQNGVMTDLGTLPGDSNSIAFDINNKGQVVGISCDVNFNCRAFLWQNGVMTDLNTLTPPNSPLFLTFGAGINDRGEIAGTACVLSNGVCTSEVPAFLAVPCDGAYASGEPCADAATGAPPATQAIGQRPSVIVPESIRQHLQKRRGFGPVKQQ